MSAIPLFFFNDSWQPDPAGLHFRGVMPVENGNDSRVVNECFVRWAAMWGGGTIRVAAHDARNNGVADTGRDPRKFDDGLDYWQVPGAARKIYVEGRRQSSTTTVAVDLLLLGK